MMPSQYETIDDIVLDAILKSRPIGEAEFWERYERLCKRNNVLALPLQAKAALRRLKQAGRITISKKGVQR